MKKHLHFLMALLFAGTSLFSQDVIVEWNFPDDSADSIADGGIDLNLDKGIYTMGGTSTLNYKNGFEGKAAQVTKWDNGAELKCWVVEFSCQLYGDVMVSSKMSSGGNDPGPRDFRIDYKVGENGNWAPVPNSEFTTANDWETGVLENVSIPNNDFYNEESVYLRWIMTSDTSSTGELVQSGGKLKIDDIVITGSNVSAVGEMPTIQVNIFPNPFTESISFENVDESGSCRIFDITGQLVKTSKITNGQQLNLPQLNSGLYNIQLFDKKGRLIISKKIIKQ